MPATFTTNSSLFPPNTREAQFDEKWAFVAKKEKNCDPSDPADDRKGDTWDHVAIDAESRLVISVIPGERTAENVAAVVADFKRRTGGRLMDLITTDGYPAYEEAILDAYGETVTPPRTGKRGRPKAPYKVAPQGLTYAVVEKTREKGRVVRSPLEWSSARSPRWWRRWECRARVGRSIRRSSSGRTARTGTATPGRLARRTDSARTGGITRRSPIFQCSFTISAGRFGRCGSKTSRDAGRTEARRWRPD